MSGRSVSGRGAAILRILQESSDDARSSNNDTKLGESTCSLGSARSVGRGKILLDALTGFCISGDSSGIGSSLQTSGRGKILLQCKNIMPTSVVEKTVEAVTESIKDMKIETEIEPVIRRGTKGMFHSLVNYTVHNLFLKENDEIPWRIEFQLFSNCLALESQFKSIIEIIQKKTHSPAHAHRSISQIELVIVDVQ